MSFNDQKGGVRWKRFGGMFAVTAALTAGLIALTAEGVLAANFSISGMQFTVTATQLHGDGFEQFATIDHELLGWFLRAAYGQGYTDALRESKRGQLCLDLGYAVPDTPAA